MLIFRVADPDFILYMCMVNCPESTWLHGLRSLLFAHLLAVVLVFWVGSPQSILAQVGSIRGVIVDEGSGQPLSGVTVRLQKDDGLTLQGLFSDANGYFAFSSLNPDRYYLRFSLVGYEPLTEIIEVYPGVLERLSLRMAITTTQAGNVTISSRKKYQPGVEVGSGLTTIRPGDLEAIPTTSMSRDLASFLQTVPGFVAPADRGGQFYVRGGTPTQNQVLVDGVAVYQPFHMVSGFSVIPEDLIAQADVYTGGWGARYGGRLASVVDVGTRHGNKKQFAGAASVDPFMGAVRLEGPLYPGAASFLVSYRQSLLDRLPGKWRRPFEFGDQFAKIHAWLTPTSSFSLVGLRSHDVGDLEGNGAIEDRISWENQAIGGRFLYLPPSFPALLDIVITSTRFDSAFGSEEAPIRFGKVKGFQGGFNFDYLLKRWEARFGMFARINQFDYRLNRKKDQENYTIEGGGYFDAAIFIHERLTVEPGLRMHNFPSQGINTLEPRFRATWFPKGKEKGAQWHMAIGQYHQQIVGLQDEQDVGEVFTVWAPATFEVPVAWHFIAGQRHRLYSWLWTQTEVYHKNMSYLSVLAGNEGLQSATGNANGMDLQLRAIHTSGSISLAYSLSQVRYKTATTSFYPGHDRRHNLSLIGNWQISRFQVSTKWQFGSGFPYTPFIGFASTLPLQADDPRFHNRASVLTPIFGEPYVRRLPAYSRIDISVEWLWENQFFKGSLMASGQNLSGRENLFYYDIYADKRVNQFGFFPTIGVRVEVK